MLTSRTGNTPDGRTKASAADNACFSQGDSFSLAAFCTWLEGKRHYQHTCLFAETLPDVVEDAEATWVRSRSLLPELRAWLEDRPGCSG